MNKDFLTITPESGGRGTTDVTVQASQNSGNARTSTITISGGVSPEKRFFRKSFEYRKQFPTVYYFDLPQQ